jgi:hypothetical protein
LIPVNLSGRVQSLLDRPYFIVISYLPISFLMMLSLDGLMNRFPAWQRKQIFYAILFLGLLSPVFFQDQRPSDCCIFFDDSDLFAFQWMQMNIPADALVGVAAIPIGGQGNILPADGGAWIETFTSIPTNFLPSDTDFISSQSALCQAGVAYIYVDGMANSFNATTLIGDAARHLLRLGNVSVYQINCPRLEILDFSLLAIK